MRRRPTIRERRNLRRHLEQLRRDLEEVQKLHREALEEIRRSNRELADIKNGRGWKIANGINVAIIMLRATSSKGTILVHSHCDWYSIDGWSNHLAHK
jgi:hypothetical protein